MADDYDSISDGPTQIEPGGYGEYTLTAGAVLDEHRILRPLGHGGMGQVYLAEHGILQMHQALKLLPASMAQNPGFVERFRSEARVMAKLQHPGIVRVPHAGMAEGRHYLIMDFIDADGSGEPFDLEDALAAAPKGRLSPDMVFQIATEICDAVAYAHSHGVVHRDLKPANILLTQNIAKNPVVAELKSPLVKVTDFGLAKLAGKDWVQSIVEQSMSLGETPTMVAQPHSERGRSDGILGTYEYMSPEQRAAREVDKRSDVYAFGVMLYRMLTGNRIMGFPKPPSRIVNGLNPAWDNVVEKCLEENPGYRFQTLEQLKAALPKKQVQGLKDKQKQSPKPRPTAATGSAEVKAGVNKKAVSSVSGRQSFGRVERRPKAAASAQESSVQKNLGVTEALKRQDRIAPPVPPPKQAEIPPEKEKGWGNGCLVTLVLFVVLVGGILLIHEKGDSVKPPSQPVSSSKSTATRSVFKSSTKQSIRPSQSKTAPSEAPVLNPSIESGRSETISKKAPVLQE